jgi:uncharacterized protein RhaS with RHS repeats
MGARYYDARLKRWLSADPIGMAGGANLYAYCTGNPVNETDPEGKCGSQNRVEFNMPGYGPAQSYQIIRGNVRQPNVNDLQIGMGVSAAGGMAAASMVPYVGEAMDAQTMMDPNAGWGWRTLATVSLGVNIASGGLLPNASAVRNGARIAEGEITSLYRAVNPDEYQQLMKSGTFQAGPNSLGGKFFAESAEHAAEWGAKMDGAGNFKVIEAQFPKSTVDTFMRWDRLDGIGPARYGELGPINSVKPIIRGVP